MRFKFKLFLLCFLVSQINCEELETHFNSVTQQFYIDFHKAFETSRIQEKRGTNLLFTFQKRNPFIEQQLIVLSSAEFSQRSRFDLSRVSTWTAIEDVENSYFFSVSQNGVATFSQFFAESSELKRLNESNAESSRNAIPLKSRSFRDRHMAYVVVLYRKFRPSPKPMYEWELEHELLVFKVNYGIQRIQTIIVHGMADMDVVDNKGTVYMVVSSNLMTPSIGGIHESHLKLFVWERSQFDIVAEEKRRGINSVCMFLLSSTVYIATAQDDESGTQKGSAIFRYNSHKSLDKLKYVQFVRLDSTSKVQHFRVNNNNYLIVVGQRNAHLLWWNGHQFLDLQTIEGTETAKDISVLTLPNREVILGILFERAVKFFAQIYNSEYVMTYERRFEHQELTGYSINSLRLLSYRQRHFFAFFGFVSQPNIQSVKLSPIWRLTLVKNDKSQQDNLLINCVNNLYQRLLERDDYLRMFAKKADSIWVNNRRQNVKAPIVVQGMVISRKKSRIDGFKITSRRISYSNVTNTRILHDINKARKEKNELQNQLKGVVYKNKPNQVVRGITQFENTLHIGHGHVGHIINPGVLLNGLPFGHLKSKVLTVTGNQVINGFWTFENDLLVDQLFVRETLNDIRVPNILLVNSSEPQIVTGNLMFSNAIVEHETKILEGGTLNGIRLEEFALLNSPLTLYDRKSFKRVETPKVDVIALTNKVDFSVLASRAVKLHSNHLQVLRRRITFTNPLVRIGDLKTRFLNGKINISEMAMFGVSKSRPQQIVLPSFYEPVTVSNILFHGLLNGVNLRRDVMTTNTKQEIFGEITFKSPSKFRHHLNLQFINGINLQTEAVKSNSREPQMISAPKIFKESISVLGNISMDTKSTIDNVDPSDLPDYIHSSQNIIFNSETVVDDLAVTGSVTTRNGINDHQVADLPRILWLKSKPQLIRGNVQFSGPVKATTVYSKDVNGFSIPSNFILASGNRSSVIFAPKVFTEATVERVFDTAVGVKVNNFHLQQLAHLMVRNFKTHDSRKRLIFGEKIFKTLEVKGNIITSKVNGLNIAKDVMLTSRVQQINGNIKFKSPQTVRHLNIDGDMELSTAINGVNLSNWSMDVVLPHTAADRLIKNKLFKNQVALNSLTAKGKLSGVNFDFIRSNVITLNTPQALDVSLQFLTDIHFFHVLSPFVNGLDFVPFQRSVSSRKSSRKIAGKKTVRGSITIKGNLVIKGTVNGVSLGNLYANTASKSRNNIFKAPMTFGSNVYMKELSVAPKARIDGIFLNQLALLNEDVEIRGKVIINGNARVDGNIHVDTAVVNNCNLSALLEDVVWLKGDQVITGKKRFNVMSVRGNIATENQKVNSVDLRKVVKRVVNLMSHNEVLNSRLTFQDDVTVRNLVLRNTVNGVDVTRMLKDAVLKSKHQDIIGRKSFKNDVIVKGPLEIVGDLRVAGLINDVDVVKLNATVVHNFGNQLIRGTKIFESPSILVFKRNVSVSNTINGLKLPHDIVVVNGEDLVPGDTLFTSYFQVDGNLNVKGLLDRKDFNKWFRNRVSLSRNQILGPNLVFKDHVAVDQLIVKGTINRLPANALVSKSKNLVIKTHTFNGDVMADGNIRIEPHGLVNGVDFTDLLRRRVDLKRPQIIPGVTIFRDVVKIGAPGMDLKGLVNGLVDMRKLSNNLLSVSKIANHSLPTLKREIHQQTVALSRLSKITLKQNPTLEYFEMWREFESFDESGSSLKFERVLSSNLVQMENDGNNLRFPISTDLYFWRVSNARFNPKCIQHSTLIYNIRDNGEMEESTSIPPGTRMFPKVSPNGSIFSTFCLWVNTTFCNIHGGKHEQVMESTAIFTVKIDDIRKRIEPKKQILSAVSTVVNDMKYFSDDRDMYAVVAHSYFKLASTSQSYTVVYIFDKINQEWVPKQQIPTFGAVSIDIIAYFKYNNVRLNGIYLAIANRLSVQGEGIPSSIFKWNPVTRIFEHLYSVDTWSPSKVLFVPTENELLVVFANEKATLYGGKCDRHQSIVLESDVHNSFFTQPVNVYQLTDKSLQYVQSINVPGANSLERFYLLSETYLVIGSKLLGKTFLHKFRGFNGFQQMQEIATPAVSSVISYWSKEGDLFLVMSSLKPGQTKILKAVISGPSPFHMSRIRAF